MKTKFLIIVAFSIFLSLITFTVFVSSINQELGSPMYIGGDTIDLDPDLSPSFAYDSHGLLKFNSIFVAGPIILGIISLAFIVPNIILRIKKIPPKKYMLVIAAAILILYGVSSIQNGLSMLTLERFEQSSDYQINLIGALIPIGIGTAPLILGIIILKKAKLSIRK